MLSWCCNDEGHAYPTYPCVYTCEMATLCHTHPPYWETPFLRTDRSQALHKFVETPTRHQFSTMYNAFLRKSPLRALEQMNPIWMFLKTNDVVRFPSKNLLDKMNVSCKWTAYTRQKIKTACNHATPLTYQRWYWSYCAPKSCARLVDTSEVIEQEHAVRLLCYPAKTCQLIRHAIYIHTYKPKINMRDRCSKR